MIPLKPTPYNKFFCPECNSTKTIVRGTVFSGIHILAECLCQTCNLEFYNDFPVGHSLLYPQTIRKKDNYLYTPSDNWFSKDFFKTIQTKYKEKIPITKKVYKLVTDIVLINCLDTLYGHSLLKLFNTQHYLNTYKDIGVVTLITKNFEWLIPAGVAEVWIIDLPMNELKKWMINLNNFIQEELQRFSNVYLSLALSLPEPTQIEFEKFTKTKRFNVSDFNKKEFTISFIWREDRLWHLYTIEKLLWLVSVKLNFKKLKQYLIIRQTRLIKKTIYKIKQQFPNTIFNVIGLGRTGKFQKWVTDYRKTKADANTEHQWCELYAQSHVVVGVHGSNMLLPTALAGGFIEILPTERWGNFLQDILLPYKGRALSYFGRFTHEHIKPKQLAKMILSLKENYTSFCVTMSDEYLKHDVYNDVSKWHHTL